MTPFNLPFLESHKTRLIDQYVLPGLRGISVADREKILTDIAGKSKLQSAVKFQELERPGPYYEGHIWFSVSAILHGYYYSSEKQLPVGTRIWKRRELVFFSSSLLNQDTRTNFIQLLEPGEVLSISYPDFRELMETHPEIENIVTHLSAKNEQYYQLRNTLLNMPPLERVKHFKEENQLFIRCTSQEVQSMHVNLSRVGYIQQLNKLKQQHCSAPCMGNK